MYFRSANVALAMDCRFAASWRFSPSRRLTVPSSSQLQAIEVITPGVFQMVALMVLSIAGIQREGAATNPTRSPVATLLDKPDTYTVLSGASAAKDAGASSARNA